MITISNVSKNFGPQVLFENISLSINQGEKIGLIGPNGAGKSTLFSLIRQEAEPSSGTVQINKNVHIGYLPQEAKFHSDHTVIAELTEGDARILKLKKEKEELEEKGEAASNRYGDVLHQLEILGFFELEHKAEKILSGLGFKERDFTKPITALSGGWQMRVLLAKLLTYQYDILLLDEPTNYLDLNAALWLKDYLAGFNGTFIMISHDKAFLTDVTNYTFILENGRIFRVRGNYEHYEQIKAERKVHLAKQFKEQEKKREQLERYVERFHAQPNKAASVRAKRTALERLEDEAVELPPDTRESIKSFKFPSTKSSGHMIVTLENISKAYGDLQVYNGIDFEINRGEKAVLVGENGAGKSTLLKILAGVVPIDSGVRKLGHNVEAGYFSQTRLDVLHPDNTVLQEAYTAAPGYMAEESIRTILGAFLFSGEDSDKKVKVLSGGEKSRLILAKLLIDPPNFLLLDEPTTHLDVDAVDALVRALTEYEGTIVCISHDIHFVRSVANIVFEVKDGNIRKFPGNFDYYLEKRLEPQSHIVARKKPVDEAKQKVLDERQRQKDIEHQKKEEERRRKNHNASIRDKIKKLEKEKETLNIESYAKVRALSNPHIYREDGTAAEYGKRLKEIETRVAAIDAEVVILEREMV